MLPIFDDPKNKISKHFTAGEATFLPSWGQYHTPSEEEYDNILHMATIMDLVREFLGKPIKVHCWIRPEAYNKAIRGAHNSSHILGKAVDFYVEGMTCDAVRTLLIPKLEEFGLRMENKPGSNWIHLDCQDLKPGGHRFFKP